MPTRVYDNPAQVTVTTRGGGEWAEKLCPAVGAFTGACLLVWMLPYLMAAIAVACWLIVFALGWLIWVQYKRARREVHAAALAVPARPALAARQARQLPAPARAIARPTDADALSAALVILRAHAAQQPPVQVLPARVLHSGQEGAR